MPFLPQILSIPLLGLGTMGGGNEAEGARGGFRRREKGAVGGGNRRGGPPLEGNLARRKQANLEQGQSKDRGGEFAQALGTTDLIICSQDQTVL